MSYLSRLFAALRDRIVWAAFDLQRSDGAAAQAVVLIDPATNDAYSASKELQFYQRQTVSTTYSVVSAFSGASVGDIVSCTQLLDVSANTLTTLAVGWRNQTTSTDLVIPPLASNLAVLGKQSLTNDQLRAAPLPVSVLTSPEIEVKNDSGSPLSVVPVAIPYADRSVSSMSTQQAAGTSAVLGVNTARHALVITPPTDCFLSIVAGSSVGIPLFAGIPNTFSGPECPSNAIFVLGLSAGNALTIWEA